MPDVFIENDRDAEVVEQAVRELDPARLGDLREHAARLLEQQRAEL